MLRKLLVSRKWIASAVMGVVAVVEIAMVDLTTTTHLATAMDEVQVVAVEETGTVTVAWEATQMETGVSGRMIAMEAVEITGAMTLDRGITVRAGVMDLVAMDRIVGQEAPVTASAEAISSKVSTVLSEEAARALAIDLHHTTTKVNLFLLIYLKILFNV